MTRIFGDTYKKSMREATEDEKKLITSIVNELKDNANTRTREGVIYTVFGAIAAFVAIVATAPHLISWFTAILCVGYVLMLAYWTYDIVKCHRASLRSINDIVNGNYVVASGEADDCSVIRFKTCVDGYVGDSIQTRVEFDIGSEFVEDKEHDRKFLLITNHEHAYVISEMPDGVTLLVSDDVTIHETSKETTNN